MGKILETVMDKAKLLLGAIFTSIVFVSVFFSVPVYLFRCCVVILAKVFRHDLGEILGGFSSVLVNDYFANIPSPRANTIVTMVLEGALSLQEVRARVMKNWIHARDSNSGELSFKKFQQYPERWLGFTFWKNSSSFSIDNHVLMAYDKAKPVNKEELSNLEEKLFNSHFPRKQSPWELYLVENYRDSCSEHEQKSVLIFKEHHSLADGFSTFTILLEGIYEFSMDNAEVASPQVIKRSLLQKLLYLLAIPFIGFWEWTHVLSHVFKPTPWKIPDKRKEWYQVCAKSESIPIQTVKDIKNHFGVSFTSVLLSGISAAIYKSLEASNTKKFGSKSMLCLSVLPVMGQGKKRKLTNELTAAIFEIPTISFHSSIERLKTVNCILERTKQSVVPVFVQLMAAVLGAQFYGICETLLENRAISTGLTNFPTVPTELNINGRSLVDVDFVTGGQQGDAGLGIMVLSYNQHIRVSVTVEKALMSRKEAGQFLEYVIEEIKLLYSLIKEKKA